MVIVRGSLCLPFSAGHMSGLEIERYNLYDECRKDIEYRLEGCDYGDVYGNIDDKYADNEEFLDYLSKVILSPIKPVRISYVEVDYRDDENWIDVSYHLDIDVDKLYEFYEQEKEKLWVKN